MVGHHLARVLMYDKTVGALSFDPATGLSAFQFAPEWVATGVEVSPVHMPLSPSRIYQFPALPHETFRGLPGAFADTLPDDFGNALIDAWLARVGRDRDSFTPLERLLYTGSRGMGALEYRPAIEPVMAPAERLELESLVAMAQEVLDQRADVRGHLRGDNQRDALSAILQVGTSAGGARPKAVIGINRERTEIRSGQSDLPEGFEHFLLKFDGVVEPGNQRETFGDPQGFGRMEYAYYLMALQAGIQMSYCELLEEGERAHFMTRRFDRDGNRKIHYQSLCAMDHADYRQPGHYSYEQLFSLMRRLRLSRAEALQMYRRMVFNIVARNHDDHTKNIAFLMNPQGRWQLAPAFDVAYSYKPDSVWVNSHQLSLNGKRENFVRKDLLVPAQSFMREAHNIIDEVIATVARWPEYAEQAGVFPDFSRQIQQQHRLLL